MGDGTQEDPQQDVSTGRLFRSLHAEGDSTDSALVALDLDDAVRLRSVRLSPNPGDGADGPVEPVIDPDFAHLFTEAIEADTDGADLEGSSPLSAPDPRHPDPGHLVSRHPDEMTVGIPAWIAAAMIIGVTLVIGVADVFVTGQLGWLTGIALVIVTAYAAATVRPHDGYWAVVTPALAFLLVTLTVGQLTVTGGGFWVRQGLLIPFTLGRAALWIVLATALAAVIVGMRRRRVLQR